MDAQAMVGSIGLTFFCNRCVELFHSFQKDQPRETPAELKDICHTAISAFGSLRWAEMKEDTPLNRGDIALFNTNQEIETFVSTVRSRGSGSEGEAIDDIINKLNMIIDDRVELQTKAEMAGEMKKFFDALGDYSFYAARNALE